MDIRRNRSFCRVLRNRFLGSAIIIICSLCVWTYSGSGSLISPQIGSHQLIAGTGTAILFVWLPKCPLSPSTMLRSIRSAVYYYLFLVMCMWGLVFFFVSFSYTKNSRAILIPLEEIPSTLSKTLLIATSYLGHFISLIEYKTQKKITQYNICSSNIFFSCKLYLRSFDRHHTSSRNTHSDYFILYIPIFWRAFLVLLMSSLYSSKARYPCSRKI